ncbi:hypothetical protein [Reichenbachiella agariperforans]|uniref:hypothetical protein n=1 Tax=Reichenbachiella agariperforans TaxID=156994 RepID=UPI001C098369|nr:hypothetical protein [Reichenbachiella agariperforans]MBU2914999.1 hypothetical protein [Reichenbachiella agariperforans]
MSPENKKLAEEVIDFFKKSEKSKLIIATDLKHLLPDDNIAVKVIYSLEKDFGLIERCGKSAFRLNNKGWKFTTFEQLEKESKKTPLTLYQKIYLPIFILFGLLSVYNRFFPSVSKSDFQELSRDFDSLNVHFDSVDKQIEILKEQNLNDSLQTKSYLDVTTD